MASVVGNISPILDLASTALVPDPRHRNLPYDVVLSLFKKNLHNSAHLESVFDHKNSRNRKLKANRVEYDNSSDDDNGFEDDLLEEGDLEWEKEMRRRVKEIEEMRELEKKAEELQYRVDQEYGSGEQEEDSEEEKRMRVKKELEKRAQVAREQAERRKTAQLMYEVGQKAYEKGMYGRAIEFLEAAMTIVPGPTLLGGEIQIWLAMAYEANNRHADCISLYRDLETKHPSVSIRRQAAELRYILQAPKIKITQEEMVTIPLIGSSYDSYAATWSDKYKDKDQRFSGSTTNQLPSTKDYLGDFLMWKPPTGLEKNGAFWVSLTLWIALVGSALFLQR
ncbi:hypothetical protein M569_02919 [Genlisea aurea]|uniref:Binding protein n=1 Tax=Genlisea aurea TaxID=192259 RepID=S8EGR5_9LAMI|nr:hypothetical protein M569_02919 [Genlisea aurea]